MFRAAAALAVMILATGVTSGKAQLVLRDGTVLEGVSAERRGDLILLRLEDESVATIPAENVKELRLMDDAPGAPATIEAVPPRTLAGPSTEPVSTGSRIDLLGAFPDPVPASRPPPVPAASQPTDALAGRDVTEFRPTRWYRAPIDPTWVPVSAFTSKTDVTNFRPARWTKVISSVWVPKDGFADAVSNPRRRRAENVENKKDDTGAASENK